MQDVFNHYLPKTNRQWESPLLVGHTSSNGLFSIVFLRFQEGFCQHLSRQVVAYLIQSGADVDVADSDGKTSLYMACQLPGCLNFTCLESPNLSLLPLPVERHVCFCFFSLILLMFLSINQLIQNKIFQTSWMVQVLRFSTDFDPLDHFSTEKAGKFKFMLLSTLFVSMTFKNLYFVWTTTTSKTWRFWVFRLSNFQSRQCWLPRSRFQVKYAPPRGLGTWVWCAPCWMRALTRRWRTVMGALDIFQWKAVGSDRATLRI